MRSRLFIQVLAALVTGLVLFAFFVSLFWSQVVDARFNATLDTLTADTAGLLLPEDAEQDQIARVADALSMSLTVYDADGVLIGASSAPVEITLTPTAQWQEMVDGTHWIIELPDGRIVIADVALLGLGNDGLAVTVIFGLLILAIAALMYPLIRRITRRLERLQHEVEGIGTGDLKQRITVDGNDEIAKLAASFNRSTETIADLLNRQRMLLANASHELRTPLARIRMGLELLETRDTPERRAGLQQDMRELNALIDDLITMTRFDTGAAEGSFLPVDLRALAEEEAARVPGTSVEGPQLTVMGDARMLQHLIRNLLDNAQKYGAPPIIISIGPDRLSVTDGGPGIPVKDREKVFEPFFRGAGQQNVQGSGLGLALAARIADAHGAEIKVGPPSTISVNFKAT